MKLPYDNLNAKNTLVNFAYCHGVGHLQFCSIVL